MLPYLWIINLVGSGAEIKSVHALKDRVVSHLRLVDFAKAFNAYAQLHEKPGMGAHIIDHEGRGHLNAFGPDVEDMMLKFLDKYISDGTIAGIRQSMRDSMTQITTKGPIVEVPFIEVVKREFAEAKEAGLFWEGLKFEDYAMRAFPPAMSNSKGDC